MKNFEKIEDLNINYYLLYEDKANAIDFLGTKFSRKVDRVIFNDYKKSLKLYKKNMKIAYEKEKAKINNKNNKSIFSIFKRNK